MLVLTRKKDERIKIGQDVEVVVICTSRGRVKLGIVAPPTTKVLRGELVDEASTDEAA